jgi:glycosyltransferase involved in cell wall biosynthesis
MIQKPSILIIADFPNWAYYAIQQFIVKQLSSEFDFYSDFLIYNAKTKSKNPIKRVELFFEKKKYQALKKDASYDIVVYLGFYFPELMNIKWTAKKTIRGIYTDSFPPQNLNFTGSVEEFKNQYLESTDALVCGSKKIKNDYNKILEASYFCNADVGEKLFSKKAEKKGESSSLVIGWTGNPKREFKGYYTHILPAVELAQKKHPNIEFKSRFLGPMETLPFFYEDIDVCIIASDADAGPSMYGEASLMDIPCISTNIGFPGDVIENGVNGFIVEKDVNQIAEHIIKLYEDRELLRNMSLRIRKDYLEKYSSEVLANDWRNMFTEVLKQ